LLLSRPFPLFTHKKTSPVQLGDVFSLDAASPDSSGGALPENSPSIGELSKPQADVLMEEFMQADALMVGIRVNRTQVSRLRVENRKEIKFGGF